MKQKPLILAVETSGRVGSVAIASGEKLLADITFSAPMRHSAELFPAICRLLKKCGKKPDNIEHIYISIGPGSFTGLRIAVALAKTMHLANVTESPVREKMRLGSPVKIVAVDTLDVITANATDLNTKNTIDNAKHERIAAILDAKRGQFFIAVYQRLHTKNKNRVLHYDKIQQDCLMTASQFLETFAEKQDPISLLGEGLVYYKDKFKTDGTQILADKYWTAQAQKVHLLGWEKAQKGQFEDPLSLSPFYLRKPDVKQK